jgi:hypothetical protein
MLIIILKYNKSDIVCISNIQVDEQNKDCNAYKVVLKLMACTFFNNTNNIVSLMSCSFLKNQFKIH